MLLYELWLFLVVKRWIAHSGTCSWVLGLCSQTQALLLGVIASRVPLSCVFLILLMFFKKIIPFFKKSNFLFMKQYKLDAFSKQLP